MRSMTGYGCGRATLGGGELVLELRAVNHRFLDLRLRFPANLAEGSPAAEEVGRARLQRGRIELTCRTEGQIGGGVQLDAGRARAALSQMQALRDELLPGQDVPMSLLGAVPDLFVPEGLPAGAVAEAARGAMTTACEELDAMREREGAALRRDLEARVERVRALRDTIADSADDVRTALRERLVGRIEELLQQTGTPVDRGRLEHEIALQADRADVTEELTRLDSHCEQFLGLLAAPEASVGRKLEFLLQEMGREVNTTGSKVSDLALTRCVLDLKAELERLREQVQNVL